jgi:hypothetical protein
MVCRLPYGPSQSHADYSLTAAEPEADDVKAERLDKLASFQLQMIRHAMKCELLAASSNARKIRSSLTSYLCRVISPCRQPHRLFDMFCA